jgi:hypothetical protein
VGNAAAPAATHGSSARSTATHVAAAPAPLPTADRLSESLNMMSIHSDGSSGSSHSHRGRVRPRSVNQGSTADGAGPSRRLN